MNALRARLPLQGLTALFSAMLASFQVLAEESLPEISPKICVGFDNNRYTSRMNFKTFGNCPPSSAMIAVQLSGPSSLLPVSGKGVLIRANCCELPAEDILTDEHVFTLSACPEQHVVTGTHKVDPDCNDPSYCETQLRCTKVNGKRYQLAAPRPGAQFGMGHYNWREPIQYFRTEIPVAIRYSLVRARQSDPYNADGCIGLPFGSLLVEKRRKGCKDLRFAELTFTGLPGDPPKGTSVPMYPQCDELSDPFASSPECLVFDQQN